MNQHINMSNQIVSDSKQIDVKFNNEDNANVRERNSYIEMTNVILSFNLRKKIRYENS